MSTSSATTSPRTTTRGTPCAVSWTNDWIAQVEAREQAMDRRICGARTVGGRPCPLSSDHPSGRCRYHGGAPLTGAPPANRNAVIHGLYSRRLAMAGKNNPGWNASALGAGAPDQAKDAATLPDADRPVCPFEQAEYNAIVTDVMKRTMANPENAFGLHLAHQVALLTVMVGRAARVLATKPFTDKMEESGDNYYKSVERPSAAFIAFEKLSAELRRWTQLVEKYYPIAAEVDSETALEHELRSEYDTRTDPDGLASLDAARALVDQAFAEQKSRLRVAAETQKALKCAYVEDDARHGQERYRRRTGVKPSPVPAWDVVKKVRTAEDPGAGSIPRAAATASSSNA